MDGYSVHDAATVLGIPEARVWELIARGVLAGSPEADGGMRVFLKATAPLAPPTAADEPKRNGNGNANGHAFDPFRELLTEFRNLTERYGQALLALGEARGEVASLRSRIEVLEARVDLRLPGTRRSSTVAWEMPDLPAPVAMARQSSAAPHEDEPAPPHETTDLADDVGIADEPPAATEPMAAAESIVPEHAAPEDQAAGPTPEAEAAPPEPSTPRRSRAPRVLTGDFAEALARAQDPTLADLPGAREAGEALAAYHRETAGDTAGAEDIEAAGVEAADHAADHEEDAFLTEPANAPLLDELVEAEPPPVGEAVPEVEAAPAPSAFDRGPYTTEIVEPDWFADGDFAWPAEPPPTPPDDQPDASALDLEADASAAEEDAGTTREELIVEHGDEPMAAPSPAPLDTPRDMDTGTSTEAEEIEEAGVAEPAVDEAMRNEPGLVDVPAQALAVEAPFEPPGVMLATVAMDLPEAPEIPEEAGIAEPGAEEELMWLGDEFEAAELEVAAPGWHSQPDSGAPARAEPSTEHGMRTELSDEQLAQLAREEGWEPDEVEAIRTFLGRSTAAADRPATEAPPAVHPPSSVALPVEPGGHEPTWQLSRPPTTRLALPRAPVPGDPDWLRGRRGPAATAYRRLRRLFPG